MPMTAASFLASACKPIPWMNLSFKRKKEKYHYKGFNKNLNHHNQEYQKQKPWKNLKTTKTN